MVPVFTVKQIVPVLGDDGTFAGTRLVDVDVVFTRDRAKDEMIRAIGELAKAVQDYIRAVL
jgi:hypothetical protein